MTVVDLVGFGLAVESVPLMSLLLLKWFRLVRGQGSTAKLEASGHLIGFHRPYTSKGAYIRTLAICAVLPYALGMPSTQDVGHAIKRLQWRHHREANRRLSEFANLSLAQWDVLRHLSHKPDSSLHALAEATFQTDQSMGELARRMIACGLIERCDGSGRAVRHRLTDQGRAAYDAGTGVVEQVLDETVGRLSAKDRTALLELLERSMAD
ncbi:MarR family winged helix-turn-helix transcriptional regulator [Mycolicibacterium canariasense]|uniref:MarR family winged helix-turn-helix transcriptional regulator n=1 Tax=Mycolicibacterium canariasense TaxID=228230 RepID=UPI0032D5836E